MSRPSDRAIAQAFREKHELAREHHAGAAAFVDTVARRARDIDADGMWSGAIPRGVQEALQRMIEDTFVRGPASVEDGRLVQKWAERFNRGESDAAAPEGAQGAVFPFAYVSPKGGYCDATNSTYFRMLLEDAKNGAPNWPADATLLYTTPPQPAEAAMLQRCFTCGRQSPLGGPLEHFQGCAVARDREDAELVPIVWRTRTVFGTGYKFSEEFLAKWPDFDAARAAGGGGV